MRSGAPAAAASSSLSSFFFFLEVGGPFTATPLRAFRDREDCEKGKGKVDKEFPSYDFSPPA